MLLFWMMLKTNTRVNHFGRVLTINLAEFIYKILLLLE